MIRIRIPRTPIAYPVHVARGVLARSGALLRRHDGSPVAALVTDRTVGGLFGAAVTRSLERAGYRVLRATLPDGERAKTLGHVASLCETWSRAGIGRNAVVVALGGGVVSDVAGFAAASFARGLPWAALPTTVLAQADASIGGKVGVNLATGKNLVGAFHHPVLVVADTDTLRTLRPRAYRAGLAEVVKMGVIGRPAIVRDLDRLARSGRWTDSRAIEPLVRAAAAEKASFVTRDERDEGVRRALNFGHTVGHALEVVGGYRRYLHGEAVSLGMVAELRLSVRLAGLDPERARDVETLLRRLGLPTRLRRAPGSAFWNALGRDKKRGPKALRVVLCPAIGTSKVFELSSLTTLRRVVLSLVRQSAEGSP